MAYLSVIIKNLEKHFNSHVHGQISPQKKIENIRFIKYEEFEHFTPLNDVIYIGEYNKAFDEGLDGCILLLNCEIDLSSNNYLCIMQNLNILDVFNVIQETIYSCNKLRKRKEKLFEALQYSSGVQGIINIAANFLENPITVYDTSFSLMASCPEDNHDINTETINDKKYINITPLQMMHEEKLIEKIFNSKTPFYFRRSSFIYNWLFCAIRINKSVVGYITVCGLVREIKESDVELLETLAKVLSIEMQKNTFFNHKSELKFEYFPAD